MAGIIWKLSARDRLRRLALEVQQMQWHTEEEDAMLVWQTFLAAQRSMDEIRTTLVGGKLDWSKVPDKRILEKH